jgi:hypothetical protein
MISKAAHPFHSFLMHFRALTSRGTKRPEDSYGSDNVEYSKGPDNHCEHDNLSTNKLNRPRRKLAHFYNESKKEQKAAKYERWYSELGQPHIDRHGGLHCRLVPEKDE